MTERGALVGDGFCQPGTSKLRLFFSFQSWDDRIASTAQRWADRCKESHDRDEDRMSKPYRSVGQNMASGAGIREWAWRDGTNINAGNITTDLLWLFYFLWFAAIFSWFLMICCDFFHDFLWFSAIFLRFFYGFLRFVSCYRLNYRTHKNSSPT